MLPKVSIIVTTYLEESKPYLDAAISSIYNLDYPKTQLEVILVGPEWYLPQYENVRTICPRPGKFHNPVGVNFGMNCASDDSKFLFMMNDDVILTRQSLKNLVQAAGDNDIVLGATSNCDNHDFYSLQFGVIANSGYHQLGDRQYRLEQIKPILTEMMNQDSYYPPGFIFPRTLYLYANLFPHSVWRKIGGFDEKFLTGFDDTDWCIRAQQAGVRLAIATDVLVWHCSGASADKTMGSLDSEVRKRNEEYFNLKWGL